MKYRVNTAIQGALLVADLVLLLAALLLSAGSTTFLPWGGQPATAGWPGSWWALYIVIAATWLVVTTALGTYKAVQNRLAYQEFGHLLKATAVTTIVLAGMLFWTQREVSRAHFWYFIVLVVPMLMVFRMALRIGCRLFFHRTWGAAMVAPARVVVVGDGSVLYETICTLSKCDPREVALLGYVDYLEDLNHAIDEATEQGPQLGVAARRSEEAHATVASAAAQSALVANSAGAPAHGWRESNVALGSPLQTAAAIRLANREAEKLQRKTGPLRASMLSDNTTDGQPAEQNQVGIGVTPFGAAVERLVTANGADNVVVAFTRKYHYLLSRVVAELQRLPVHIVMVPDVADLTILNLGITELGDAPALKLRAPILTDMQLALKRILDLLIVVPMLPFLLPLMSIVALAIRLNSPGPIVFRQRRVGQYGKQFTIYKFRTMVQDAEARLLEVTTYTADGKPLFKSDGVDPRITRVGRILRRLSLDELPQLFNVLMGQMSLVGPRPELPTYVGFYETWQHYRLWVPPGITGWWQVKGREKQPMYLHWDDDLYYIKNYSLLLDLQILWLTLSSAVLGSTGR